MKLRIFHFLLVISLFAVAGCKGFKFPKWEAEVLGPLAQSDLAPEDIIQVKDLKFSYTFASEQISSGGNPLFPPGFVGPVPAFGPVNVGYFDTIPTPELRSVTMKRMKLKLEIYNGFPFIVGAGTTIVLRNQNSTIDIVSFALPQDLAPGQSYEQVVDVADKTITKNLQFQLQSLTSPGTNGASVSVSNTKLSVVFTLSEYEIEKLEVNSNQLFEVRDTSNFTFTGKVVSSDAFEGNLIFSYKSGFPVTFRAQVYFLDDGKILLDSLFQNRTNVQPAITDNDGVVSVYSTARDTIVYTKAQIDKIKEAKFIAVSASASSFGSASYVVVTPQQRVTVKIIGDLRVNVNSALGQ